MSSTRVSLTRGRPCSAPPWSGPSEAGAPRVFGDGVELSGAEVGEPDDVDRGLGREAFGRPLAKLGGNTETIAFQMKQEIDAIADWDAEVHNIGATTPEKMLEYQYIIMGVPTWNTGQLQDDWEIFLPNFADMDMSGKKVAMFGLGDQNGYGYNFLDALGMLGDAVLKADADVWGLWKTNSYEYEESLAEVEDYFLGLGVDQDGQQEMTTKRIKDWVAQVIEQFEGKFATA